MLLPDGKLYLDETGHLPLDPQAANGKAENPVDVDLPESDSVA